MSFSMDEARAGGHQRDGKSTLDIEHALTNGQVVLQENKKDILWRVIGQDLDGETIEVVAAVYAEEIVIKVVTAF